MTAPLGGGVVAVTAIFRRPLGLPVPHAAIIPTRKDALGRSLQEFVATTPACSSRTRRGEDGAMVDVRRIRTGERAAALETILAAFRRDPQVRWWFRSESEYDESAPGYFGVLLDTRIEGGEVWVADGGRAVALWVPPGGNLIGPELASARYSTIVAALSAGAAERIQRTDEAVDELLPSGAHWYLGVLACHPDHHGNGLGWAVAAPVLAAADRAGLPVALETASPVNVGYYTRRGFAVIGELTLDDAVRPADRPALVANAVAGGPVANGRVAGGRVAGGVTVCVMRREPR